jgi:hypothetical protein
MSTGSFWRSLSIVTTTAPREAAKPVAWAALSPQFTEWRTTRRYGRPACRRTSASSEPSVLQSSTYTIS